MWRYTESLTGWKRRGVLTGPGESKQGRTPARGRRDWQGGIQEVVESRCHCRNWREQKKLGKKEKWWRPIPNSEESIYLCMIVPFFQAVSRNTPQSKKCDTRVVQQGGKPVQTHRNQGNQQGQDVNDRGTQHADWPKKEVGKASTRK